MSYSSTSLPKPKNWQDFENNIRQLMACVLNDPNTQQNGRSGQQQNGVDVYGRRNGSDYVGVQCKKKFENSVTEQELRNEVQKAKNFIPKIKEFILTTTAPRDQKIQEAARVITEELKNSDHPFEVFVWGWEDIEEHASKYEAAWRAFDPTWHPYTQVEFEKLSLQIKEIEKKFNSLDQKTLPPVYATNGEDFNIHDENTPLHGQITAFQRLIDDGHAKLGYQSFQKIKTESWSTASKSERYRILIGLASADFKLGKQTDAADLLINAFNECPDHKNAKVNLATGYLIKNRHKEAASVAMEVLESDNNNDHAASIIVQAYISDSNCNDPLNNVPKALHDTEQVLTAYVHFLRSRGDTQWRVVAQEAVLKHPDNNLLKIFSSEAILDELVTTDYDMLVGGLSKEVDYNKFLKAVEILYSEASEAIKNDYALLPSVAHNAVLALRLVNDNERAQIILNASLKLYPNDENLLLQQALIFLFEDRPKEIIKIIPESSSNPELTGLLANAFLATGEATEALELISKIDEKKLTGNIRMDFISLRIRSYIKNGDKQLAITYINHYLLEEPENLLLRCIQIRMYQTLKDEKAANEAFNNALLLVNDETSLSSRLELSFEARRLNRHNIIIELLKNRVATDRESEALNLLIETSIDKMHWATAHEIINSLPEEIREKNWYRKAEAILAIKTGDILANEKITQYLKQCPNDMEMILIQLGMWQRSRKDSDIKKYLKEFNSDNYVNQPEDLIKVASLICQYDDVTRGISLAYSILMDNWNKPQVHLIYQGLIFFQNESIDSILNSHDIIAENTVVGLITEDGERRIRIENQKYVFFEEERLDINSEVSLILMGKEVGSKFNLHDKGNLNTVEIKWVKSIYLDALHKSLEQFNDRFPKANGLQRFKIDLDSPDPIDDIKNITKSHAEFAQRILQEYIAKSLPLSFASKFLKRDPLGVYYGLPAANVKFQVCRGFLQERENALKEILKHNKKGCIVDIITLTLIHRLGISDAVTAICGPIYTTQSVIDLLVEKSMDSKLDIGKKQGFLGWHNNQLILEEYSEEYLRAIADKQEEQVTWAREMTMLAPIIPKKDFSNEIKTIIEMFGNVCDSAIAAEGCDLLLLSEDFGLRIWAKEAFNIPTTWLQPVLTLAKDKGYLAQNDYCEVVNSFVFNGHTYVSLDPDCLLHQVRKDNYKLTKELTMLFEMLGGPSADLDVNTNVLSVFIDMLQQECDNFLDVRRIVSEIFTTFIKGRKEDKEHIINLILKGIKINKKFLQDHSRDWIIGHSIGMTYFNEFMRLRNN